MAQDRGGPRQGSFSYILFFQSCRIYTQDPWFEYIDYWSVQQSQSKCINDWQRLCSRDTATDEEEAANSATMENREKEKKWRLDEQNIEPIERIYRRLSSYERPKDPPSLARNIPLLEHVPRDSLTEPDQVVNMIRPHLKIILDYAQTYNLLVSEHTAVDCNFLELVPTLYKEVENRVTLHALCDPAPAGGSRRSRAGTPPTVHCAGPAVIRIKVRELYNHLFYLSLLYLW